MEEHLKASSGLSQISKRENMTEGEGSKAFWALESHVMRIIVRTLQCPPYYSDERPPFVSRLSTNSSDKIIVVDYVI